MSSLLNICPCLSYPYLERRHISLAFTKDFFYIPFITIYNSLASSMVLNPFCRQKNRGWVKLGDIHDYKISEIWIQLILSPKLLFLQAVPHPSTPFTTLLRPVRKQNWWNLQKISRGYDFRMVLALFNLPSNPQVTVIEIKYIVIKSAQDYYLALLVKIWSQLNSLKHNFTISI